MGQPLGSGLWRTSTSPPSQTMSASFLMHLATCSHSSVPTASAQIFFPRGSVYPKLFSAQIFPIPCPASPQRLSYPSLWSCPGSTTAFRPKPPSALHLHIPPMSKLCWPFCRCVAAPWPGTPLDQGLVQLWLSREAAMCPARGDTPRAWLLPAFLNELNTVVAAAFSLGR